MMDAIYVCCAMQNDGGVNNNCFNLDCGGFHLYESPYALGSSISGADSQVGGERYGVPVGIHRVRMYVIAAMIEKLISNRSIHNCRTRPVRTGW